MSASHLLGLQGPQQTPASCNWYTNYTMLKEIKQTYLEKRTLVKNFSCRIQYSFYDEQPHGVGPDQNMKVQANDDMKYPIS